MPLNLSPDDAQLYADGCRRNEMLKHAAEAVGDKVAAKKARQANTQLYHHFKARELPHEPSMSLEERVRRLELIIKELMG